MVQDGLRLLAYSVAYFGLARFSLLLALTHSSISPVWVASGFAIALLHFRGRRMWPAVFIGALALNGSLGTPLWAAACIAVGNTLEAVIGAWIYRRLQSVTALILHQRETVCVSAAGLGSCVVSAIIGVASLRLAGLAEGASAARLMLTWGTGDLLGCMIGFPFFSVLFSVSLSKAKNMLRWRSLALTVSAVVGCGLIFYFMSATGAAHFLLFGAFLAVAFHARGGHLPVAAFCVCVLAVITIRMGAGPFVMQETSDQLVHAQLFLFSIALTALMLPGVSEGKDRRFVIVTLLVGWTISASVFQGFVTQSNKDNADQFDNSIRSVMRVVQRRMDTYADALRGGAGLYTASDHVDATEWRDFIASQKMFSEYPGVRGMGVIEFKEGGQTPRYLVKHVEPLSENPLVIGFDFASESGRKAAAERARDLNEPVLTYVSHLIQDSEKRPAMLMLVPVYKRGVLIRTVEERGRAIVGWLYAAFIVEDFIQSVLSEKAGELWVSVFVPDVAFGERLIFSNDPNPSAPRVDRTTTSLNLHNQAFRIVWGRGPDLPFVSSTLASWAGGFGVFITLLCAALVSNLQMVTVKANAIAHEKAQQLFKNEQLWRALMEVAPVGIFQTDIRGRCTFVNYAWCKITGLNPEEARGDGWSKALHFEDKPRIFKEWNDFADQNRPSFVSEYRYVNQSMRGKEVWVIGNGVRLTDAHGMTIGFLGTIQDITAMKEKERSLRLSEERVRLILETTLDAVLMVDSDGLIRAWNPSAEKVFGWNEGQVLGRPAHSCIPRWSELRGHGRREATGLRLSGEEFPMELSITSFQQSGKDVFSVFCRDLTEQKNIESALEQERRKLAYAAKMSSLGEMAGGISHEINNPLAIIQGKAAILAQMAKAGKADAANVAAYAQKIDDTAFRIARIIKGLKAFARNAEQDPFQRASLRTIVDNTLELCRERIRLHGIDLKVDPVPDLQLECREAQVCQVLLNLLNNAYDAVEASVRPWISVGFAERNEGVEIRITDSGTGISAEDREKIMQPFFTTKDVGKGTGLGLSISKGIMEEHSGTLSLNDFCPNTQFIIWLPLRQQKQPGKAAA